MSLSKEALPANATTPLSRTFVYLVNKLLPRLGDRWTFAAVNWLAVNSVWIPLCGFLLYADKKGWFERWRIEKSKYPEESLLRQMTNDMLREHFVTSPFFGAFLTYPLLLAFGLPNMAQSVATMPDWKQFLKYFAIYVVIEDTYFYWAHRLFHEVPFLYKTVHKQHHRFHQVVAPAATWAHPLEGLLVNLGSIMAGPAIVGGHTYTWMVYACFKFAEAINAHSGLDLPWSPFNWFPNVLGGSDRHAFHHSHNSGMFGGWFKFWDWICGTDKTYWESRRRRKQGLEDLKGEFGEADQ